MTTATSELTRVRDYVNAGGLKTYYEAVGEGVPLVLLHGGLCTVETFEGQTAGAARRWALRWGRRRSS